MRLGFARSAAAAADAGPRAGTAPICLQCGVMAVDPSTTYCRRCGLPFGALPRDEADLPACPICYQVADADGRIASRAGRGRLDLVGHMNEHGQFPVGDDEYLETLRAGDRIRIGRFSAPFDLVRRYLVTGSLDGGRRRMAAHNAIVMAMAQIGRWGSSATVFGDQPEWREAREAVTALLERYAAERR